MPEQAVCEDWVGTAHAAKRLGYSQVTIWRLCQSGDLPSLRAGKDFRLPGHLVEAARSAVMAGGSVVLSEFARQWSADAAGAVA
jgi:excisionase family DNA binding protein